MNPDDAWSKGDGYTRRGQAKVRQFTRWAAVEHGAGDENDWESTVDKLISRVSPFADAIRKLPTEVEVVCQVFLTENNGVFGFGLSAQHIKFLGTIGASLDMSVVVYDSSELPEEQ